MEEHNAPYHCRNSAWASREQPTRRADQGLTTGNQNQDQALRNAFERGYQRGRQDEARMRRPSGGSDRSYSRSRDDNNGDGYGSKCGSDRSRSGDYER